MPYKNIVFVKLEKRLLNDHRWFTMSEKAQLLYIKLMLGCAETYNKLPSESLTLRQQLRITWKKSVFDSAIKEIENNFPKFKKVGNYYYFEDFENKTNYIRECPSNAQILPKVGADKEEDIDKEEDKIKKLPIRCWSRPFTNNSELALTENLIKEFGFDRVEQAFRKAGENGITKIPYVRGILNKEAEKEKPKKRFGSSEIMNELYGGKDGH